MPARKRNIEIEVLVDDKQVKAKLGNIEKEVTKTGKAFSTAGKLFVGAFAGAQVVDFGRDSVRAFTDLNESVNAINVVFGESAEGVKALGENAAESVGLANAEFNSLAVGVSAFAEQIAGVSGQDVVDVIDEMTVRIADFASVMNLDVNEAAEKFRSGLAGETEPLRKFGIDVSAARLKTEALAMGIGDASGNLTEQQKILVRYKTIMDQTNKTAGDFANTSDELANSQRILAAKIEDTKAIIGSAFAPAVEGVLPLLEDLAEVAGVVGIQFGVMIGTIDRADAALAQHAIQSGHASDSAVNLVGSMKLLTEEFEEVERKSKKGGEGTRDLTEELMALVDASGIATDELRFLVEEGLDDLVAAQVLTEEQALLLAEALGVELRNRSADALAAIGQLGGGADELKEKMTTLRTGAVKPLEDAMGTAGEAALLIKERMLAVGNQDVTDAWIAAGEAAGIFGAELVTILTRLGLIVDQIQELNSLDPNININTENLGFPETQIPTSPEQLDRIR
jgi:hypothetical protein